MYCYNRDVILYKDNPVIYYSCLVVYCEKKNENVIVMFIMKERIYYFSEVIYYQGKLLVLQLLWCLLPRQNQGAVRNNPFTMYQVPDSSPPVVTPRKLRPVETRCTCSWPTEAKCFALTRNQTCFMHAGVDLLLFTM